MRQVKVAIIGAGTAGLSARREVAKVTDDYVVIDDGPLGTTCARVGCMPSKVLIEIANTFHKRQKFDEMGILGGSSLAVDQRLVMQRVRALRDRFVKAVREDMHEWEASRLLRGRASFVDRHTLSIGDEQLRAEKIIIATGSSPVMPAAWREVAGRVLDTDAFFELADLPSKVAVIGLGVIGIELGQALSRLGVEVYGITLGNEFGGVTDPLIQSSIYRALSEEFPIDTGGVSNLQLAPSGELEISTPNGTITVNQAFATIGRRPNLSSLNLAAADIVLQKNGLPEFDDGTYRIGDTDIYLVGDVNAERPILHEASDQGRIAGYNAVRQELQCFRKRSRLSITFSDPNIAMVGESHKALLHRSADFVAGHVTFRGQGRAIVKHQEVGDLSVYVDRVSGKLLGAELFAPDGEHLAHLLAWGLEKGLTVHQMLAMPFYHPVTAEGLRTALRAAAKHLKQSPSPLEILRCQDAPIR